MYPHVVFAPEDFGPLQDGWNRSKTMKLIRAYRKHPVLYCAKVQVNKKTPIARTEAFRRISQDTGYPMAAVEKKIATLRSQYFRELAKIQRSRRSGRGYVPNWYAFQLLTFLGGDDKNTGGQDATASTTPGQDKLRFLLTRVSPQPLLTERTIYSALYFVRLFVPQ